MSRHERGVRALGLSPSSRLSRPPQLLQEPDVRPRVRGGNYYIDDNGANTYLLTNINNPLSIIWDETTQIGGGPQINYDPGTSLTFLQVGTDITIREYTPGGGGGNPDTGYLFVSWDHAAGANFATVTLSFYSDAFTLQEQYTATNSDDAFSAFILLPNDVSVPAGGLILAEITFASGGISTNEQLYAEMWLHWT